MLAIPALDLRDGACVQLVGGSYDAEAIRIADPLAVALQWEAAGFQDLHIVDLDAATGRGSNASLVAQIVRESRLRCQVGGGIRDTDAMERVLDLGAQRVVVGTRALEDPAWLSETAARFPGCIVVAADTAERVVVTRGWQSATGTLVTDVVLSLAALPLAAVLVTAVHKEGRLTGPDFDLMRDVVAVSELPIQASGGITTMADLQTLETIGIGAAVLGMALYTRTLDPRTTARSFNS